MQAVINTQNAKGDKKKRSPVISGFVIWRVTDLVLNVNINFPSHRKRGGLLVHPFYTLIYTGIQFASSAPPTNIHFGSRELYGHPDQILILAFTGNQLVGQKMKYSVREDCYLVTSSSESLIFLLISLGINDLVLLSVLIPDKDFRLLGFLQCLPLNSVAIWIFSSFLFALLIDFKCFLKMWMFS